MGESKGLVLVVEDEKAIADLERLYLSRAGYGVQVEADGRAGLAAARALHPVAIILDVGLPILDGTEVCRALRADGDWTPVLFVTARDDEVDRVVGLELGADDYITKPFSPRELVARVKTVLRRSSGGGAADERVTTLGEVTLDPARRRMFAAGTEVALTTTEFDLLAYLMRRPGRVFPREQLLSEVWGYAAAAGTRTVDVHVSQARATLGRQAEILAGAPGLLSPANRRIDRIFTQQNIQVVVLTAAGRETRVTAGVLTEADRTALSADQPVSRVTRLGGNRVLVEGRALEAGGGVVLVQRESVVGGVAVSGSRRILVALRCGLVVRAVAGLSLGRRRARGWSRPGSVGCR